MNEYSPRMAGPRGSSARSVVSVADTIDNHQLYNSSHPLYKEYTRKLEENLAAIIARESEKQAKAQQAVCTVALSVEEREEVAREYPEFRVVWPMWSSPVHASWAARRQLVNQHMTHRLQRYASSYVHYGGSALGYLTAGESDVALRVHSASPVAVNESFDDDVACGKLAASMAGLASGLGWIIDPGMMRSYASRDILMKDCSVTQSSVQAQALIVDGSLYALSPVQFAAAMVQHGSDIGMFALPYHPSMMVSPEGLMPGTDVSFESDEGHIIFRYTDGVAGVTSYVSSVWHQWLLNTIRSVTGISDFSFQFELMGTRGCFMIIQVVRVQGPPPVGVKFVHSLELEDASAMTLVRTWRLKNLAVNPSDESAWEQVLVTVPTRVVEKTHDFAMALDADQFSRHAIRKRLAVTNDRIVIQGTSVEVYEALSSSDLDVLEIAIFTHCFVARYETGKLSAALKKLVDQYAGFGQLSFVGRLAHVVVTCAGLAYDWTLGVVDDVLRNAFDSARRWLGGLPKIKGNAFEPAPQFIRYETLVRSRGKAIFDAVRSALAGCVKFRELDPGMPGFTFLAALRAAESGPSVNVPLMDNDYTVRRDGATVFSDIVDTSVGAEPTANASALYSRLREMNEFDQDSGSRHYMEVQTNPEDVLAEDISREDYSYDPGYIATMDDFHDACIPGLRGVDFKYDPTSISVDDQDRSLAADYLVMPLRNDELPKQMNIYASKLKAYNVTKRPMTAQETLSAMQARNLSAPVLALPQDEDTLVERVIEDWLDIACVPDAREKLRRFQTDPVSLEERAMIDWTSKAKPETVNKVLKYMLENPEAVEELRVDHYESMIKTDVKPPLSDKPLLNRLEPQLIVHHMSVVNAIYSSIFRVLVRRFVSLLKPNFMLNLLKDMPQVRDVIQTHHEWNAVLTFLENDFSKYDKSQGRFVFLLERVMFKRLGMNESMLKQWGLGHIDCKIHSVTTGISLHVRYQRKSGDATTAFGNGMLNMMSVLHAYKGSDIVWAVFMGDDSLVAVRKLVAPELAVRALAEKFNLQAKFFVSTAPYFASNFILLNKDERRVTCVPDPVKRVEKWSMAVPAVDPKWEERYQSALTNLAVYKNRSNLVGLAEAVYERYGTHGGMNFQAIGDALASAIRSFEDFRCVWEKDIETIVF